MPNASDRDSLPEKNENSPMVSSQNLRSLNDGVEPVEEPRRRSLSSEGVFFMF